MTHLKIEQNNGVTEQVSPSVIEKLYEIVHSENLDSSSNLMGSLNTTSTYLDYVDYLEELFTKNGIRLLIITANKLYISFADPEILRVLAGKYGDGTGVTSLNMSSITELYPGLFNNNTTITSFNELSRFSSIKTLKNNCFRNASNLTSIDLSNIERIESSGLSGTALTSISLPNCTYIGQQAFYQCANLTSIDLSNVLYISNRAFVSSGLSGNINLPNFINFTEYYYYWENYSEAFRNTAITSVTFGLNYTGILSDYGGIFAGCTSLTTVSGLKTNPNEYYFPASMFLDCTSLVSIGNLDLSHYTKFKSRCFSNCTSLPSSTFNINPSIITLLGESVFAWVNMGENQTLELNLTDLTAYPHNALAGTKYTRLILHSPQLTGTMDSRYPIYNSMQQLTYLDLSDWYVAQSGWENGRYDDMNLYNLNSLITYIAPVTTNYLETNISRFGNISSARYLILLSITPPRIETTDSSNPPSHWFYNKGGNVHIYVPNGYKLTYLNNVDWASIGGYNGSDTISSRLHELSELPNGVWTTGLASQYLTPALLATS